MPDLVQKTPQELADCIKAQADLWKGKRYPNFAPANGICWKCHRNIYQNYEIDGHIHHGRDGTELVTGCPHCHRSYCD